VIPGDATFVVNDEMTTVASASGARSALHVTVRADLPGHLYFYTRDGWVGEIPQDQGNLRIAFDDVCAVLRARFGKDEEKFGEQFRRLLALAHAAFAEEYAQVDRATASLNAYKSELIRQEGAAIKNLYLKELAVWALVSSVCIVFLAGAVRYAIYVAQTYGLVIEKKVEATVVKSAASAIRWDANFSPIHFGLLLGACMWGIWLSFAVRSMTLEFEQLQHPESDMMRPWSRLLAFGLLALILALFFQMEVLVISIGGVSTSQISSNALVAVFVGLCLGFTDKALPGEVRKRIEEFFQSARLSKQ
jgi:hypothetical protein